MNARILRVHSAQRAAVAGQFSPAPSQGIIMDATRNIVDTAISTGFFTTFADGLKTAALTDTLNAAGPFTVFAPTDEAFKKLPPGQLEALRKDTRKFTSLLKHHVVAGKLLAKDVKSGEIKNVQGGMLRVEIP